MSINEIIAVMNDSLEHSKEMGVFYIERYDKRVIVKIPTGQMTQDKSFVLDNVDDDYIEKLIQAIKDKIIDKRDYTILYGVSELKGPFLDFFIFGDQSNKKIEIFSNKDYNLLKEVYEDYQKENNGEIVRR